MSLPLSYLLQSTDSNDVLLALLNLETTPKKSTWFSPSPVPTKTTADLIDICTGKRFRTGESTMQSRMAERLTARVIDNAIREVASSYSSSSSSSSSLASASSARIAAAVDDFVDVDVDQGDPKWLHDLAMRSIERCLDVHKADVLEAGHWKYLGALCSMACYAMMARQITSRRITPAKNEDAWAIMELLNRLAHEVMHVAPTPPPTSMSESPTTSSGGNADDSVYAIRGWLILVDGVLTVASSAGGDSDRRERRRQLSASLCRAILGVLERVPLGDTNNIRLIAEHAMSALSNAVAFHMELVSDDWTLIDRPMFDAIREHDSVISPLGRACRDACYDPSSGRIKRWAVILCSCSPAIDALVSDAIEPTCLMKRVAVSYTGVNAVNSLLDSRKLHAALCGKASAMQTIRRIFADTAWTEVADAVVAKSPLRTSSSSLLPPSSAIIHLFARMGRALLPAYAACLRQDNKHLVMAQAVRRILARLVGEEDAISRVDDHPIDCGLAGCHCCSGRGPADMLGAWELVSSLTSKVRSVCTVCQADKPAAANASTSTRLKLCDLNSGGCDAVMYCGMDCARAGWRNGHRLECKSLRKCKLGGAPECSQLKG
jgi:hypothetical protein